jgi:hypothetical protein
LMRTRLNSNLLLAEARESVSISEPSGGWFLGGQKKLI